MSSLTPNHSLIVPDATDPVQQVRNDYATNLNIIDGMGGGHTIVDENGTEMPSEGKLQFTGGVQVSDDNVNGVTVVNVSGGNGLILDASIYSEDEQVVGVWTDGKPLYKKSYKATITSGSQWIDTGRDSGDEIVWSEGTLHQNNGQILTLSSGDSSANAGINTFIVGVVTPDKWACLFRTNNNDARGALTLTLYYTKGSDVAGSGGFQAYGFSPIIYSDVERVIGVWRDNKPLYARCFHLQGEITTSGDNWYNTNVDTSAMETVVRAMGWDASFRVSKPILASANYNPLKINSPRNGADYIEYIYLEYTKTTDVAGSGDYNTLGVPTVHYSTDEQVIGTYFGKPFYQKSVVINSAQSSGALQISTGILDIDELASIEGIASYDSNGVNVKWLPLPFADDNQQVANSNLILKINSFIKTTGIIYGFIGSDYQGIYAINRIRLTLKYTKTSD